MGRNPRRYPRELVHDGAIFKLLMNVGWFARDWEFAKTRAAASGAPGWNGDGQIFQIILDAFDVATAPRQLAVKALIVVPKYRDFFRIKIVDLIPGQR